MYMYLYILSKHPNLDIYLFSLVSIGTLFRRCSLNKSSDHSWSLNSLDLDGLHRCLVFINLADAKHSWKGRYSMNILLRCINLQRLTTHIHQRDSVGFDRYVAVCEALSQPSIRHRSHLVHFTPFSKSVPERKLP